MNERLARLFPGENPVGRYIVTFGTKDGQTTRLPTEIVGVVRDVIHRSPRDEARPVLYTPAAQETFALSPATIVVRSRLSPTQIVDTVAETVSHSAADLALFDVKNTRTADRGGDLGGTSAGARCERVRDHDPRTGWVGTLRHVVANRGSACKRDRYPHGARR